MVLLEPRVISFARIFQTEIPRHIPHSPTDLGEALEYDVLSNPLHRIRLTQTQGLKGTDHYEICRPED